MKPKLIIFDWDGTLADTTNPIIHTFQQSFADCGLPVPEADQIRPLIGYSLSGIIRRLAHNVSEHVQETLIETYAAHYLNPNNHNMTLFPEALPCLQRLKQQGYWLAERPEKAAADWIGPSSKPAPKPSGWKPPALANIRPNLHPIWYSPSATDWVLNRKRPSSLATPPTT